MSEERKRKRTRTREKERKREREFEKNSKKISMEKTFDDSLYIYSEISRSVRIEALIPLVLT